MKRLVTKKIKLLSTKSFCINENVAWAAGAQLAEIMTRKYSAQIVQLVVNGNKGFVDVMMEGVCE